jgi:hypothetical protein
MKLVAVMSLDGCCDDLRQIYRDHAVQVFSEIDIQGYYHREPAKATDVSWFGRFDSPAYSTLTWAFLADDQATGLMDAIAAYNAERNLDHPVRAFELPVDRAV